MDEKVKGVLSWVAVVGVVAGCGWLMFGDRLLLELKSMRAGMSYEVSADEKSSAIVHSRMRRSLLWKAYFVSVDEAAEGSAGIRIALKLDRRLFGPPVSEPDRYNSNGHVDAALTVTKTGQRQPLFEKKIQYKLPAVFTFTSESTGNGQEDVFLSVERKAADEVAAYLDVAAMRAMALNPAKAADYAPLLAKCLDDTQIVIYEAAAETLCGFGAAAGEVAPRVRKTAGKRSGRARNAAKRVLASIGNVD